MDKDEARLQQQSQALRERHEHLTELIAQAGAGLDTLSSQAPAAEGIARLERLQTELAKSVQAYLSENAAYLALMREHARQIEEAERKAAMSEKNARPPRDQARIQELSDQLSRDLRLERIDNAIKELLDFLADTAFFAENASTGRRRRLKSLQTALEKALQK